MDILGVDILGGPFGFIYHPFILNTHAILHVFNQHTTRGEVRLALEIVTSLLVVSVTLTWLEISFSTISK